MKGVKGRLPPGPVSALPFGLYLRYSRDPTGFLQTLGRDYGDAVHFRIGPQRIFFFRHPELIREVLVTQGKHFVKCRSLERVKRLLGEGLLTSDGELHKRRRRLIQPAFHQAQVARYAGVMTAYAERLSARWYDGQRLDMHGVMMRLTLAIVAQSLFGAELEGEATELGEALGEALAFLALMPSPLSPLMDALPLPRNIRFWRARARLDATIYRLLKARRGGDEDQAEPRPDDLLAMLLAAREDEASGGMTDLELRDEAITLLLAGHETTANALAWTWYLLALHAVVESKLHRELDEVLAGAAPTADSFGRLVYTKMVFAEALRLYPPAYIIGRRALRDCTVGGYLVPAGAIVNISPFVTQRDPRFFPEPGAFRPERWQPEAQIGRPKFSFFPFGGGARVCIGEGFAWAEGVLVLASLARAWRARLIGDRYLKTEPLLTLRPKGGVAMIVTRR